MWALFAAGGALVSFLLSAIETKVPNWTTVAMIFVGTTLVTEIVTLLTTLVPQLPTEADARRRFRFVGHRVANSRLFVWAAFFQSIVLLGVVLFASFPIDPVCSWGLYICLVLFAVLMLTAVVVSLVQPPLPAPIEPKRRWVYAATFFLVLASGVVGVVGIAIALFSPYVTTRASVSDWRVGLTVTALSYVLLLLARVRSIPALLPELKNVECRLAFGQLTLSDARQKADRILHGMTLNDLLGPLVVEVVRGLETLETRISGVNDQLNLVDKLISDPNLSNDEKISTLEAILCASRGKLAEPNTVVQSLLTFGRKALQIVRTAPWMAEEANSFAAGISDAIKRIDFKKRASGSDSTSSRRSSRRPQRAKNR